MIGVLADVVEVVVFAAGADALLRIGGALVGPVAGAEEDVLELVHAGVGEQQRRVVGGTTLDDGTMVWPCFLKKSRNCWRISFDVSMERLIV